MNNPERRRRSRALIESVTLCRILDAVERDAGRARIAFLMAQREIERVRVRSQAVSRGRLT